jgi:hypothetical protein
MKVAPHAGLIFLSLIKEVKGRLTLKYTNLK